MSFTLKQLNKMLPEIQAVVTVNAIEGMDRQQPIILYSNHKIRLLGQFIQTNNDYSCFALKLQKAEMSVNRSIRWTTTSGYTIKYYEGESGSFDYALWEAAWKVAEDDEKEVLSHFPRPSPLLSPIEIRFNL